jgi:hypothetical protein
MPLREKSPRRASSKNPKTDPFPVPSPMPVPDSERQKATRGNSTPVSLTRAANPLMDLSGVSHGLSFPGFDANQYFAHDLFTDSSALPRTTKTAADAMVQSIEEKRQSLRIAMANIGLNQDVTKTATEQRKLEGMVIDYAKVGMVNGTKYIQLQTSGVDQMTAQAKYEQAVERLNQEEFVLNGMRGITPLIPIEWAARRELKLSKIQDLRTAVLRASAKMDGQLDALASDFQNDVQSLG